MRPPTQILERDTPTPDNQPLGLRGTRRPRSEPATAVFSSVRFSEDPARPPGRRATHGPLGAAACRLPGPEPQLGEDCPRWARARPAHTFTGPTLESHPPAWVAQQPHPPWNPRASPCTAAQAPCPRLPDGAASLSRVLARPCLEPPAWPPHHVWPLPSTRLPCPGLGLRRPLTPRGLKPEWPQPPPTLRNPQGRMARPLSACPHPSRVRDAPPAAQPKCLPGCVQACRARGAGPASEAPEAPGGPVATRGTAVGLSPRPF